MIERKKDLNSETHQGDGHLRLFDLNKTTVWSMDTRQISKEQNQKEQNRPWNLIQTATCL